MILLDTCTLLWLVDGQQNLSEPAKKTLLKNKETPSVSAISAFEIGIKHRKGLLKLPLPPSDWFFEALRLHGLTELPISAQIAILTTQLPLIHNDPADRMLIATAMNQTLTILTPDKHIQAYPDVKTSW